MNKLESLRAICEKSHGINLRTSTILVLLDVIEKQREALDFIKKENSDFFEKWNERTSNPLLGFVCDIEAKSDRTLQATKTMLDGIGEEDEK